jgi:hypothetical protein
MGKLRPAAVVLLLTLLCGCSRKVAGPAVEKEDKRFKNYEKATVVNFKGRDGCDFALQLESGENLEPERLPEEFQKDGTLVWIRYRERKEVASLCMIGKMISITDIRKR